MVRRLRTTLNSQSTLLKRIYCRFVLTALATAIKAIEQAFSQVSLDDIRGGLLTAVTVPH
jgi:hypothetical protein